MITSLMSQEEMLDMYINNIKWESEEKGKQEGIKEGIEKGIEKGKFHLLEELRNNPQLLKEYGIIP